MRSNQAALLRKMSSRSGESITSAIGRMLDEEWAGLMDELAGEVVRDAEPR